MWFIAHTHRALAASRLAPLKIRYLQIPAAAAAKATNCFVAAVEPSACAEHTSTKMYVCLYDKTITTSVRYDQIILEDKTNEMKKTTLLLFRELNACKHASMPKQSLFGSVRSIFLVVEVFRDPASDDWFAFVEWVDRHRRRTNICYETMAGRCFVLTA